MTEKTVEPHVDTAPESPNPIGANRRTVVKGMAAAKGGHIFARLVGKRADPSVRVIDIAQAQRLASD